MKKRIGLLTSLFLIANVTPVFSQNDDHSKRISEIESQISELESELTELQGDETNEVIGMTFSVDDLRIKINDVYLTKKRSDVEDLNYDNVLVLDYTLQNNKVESYPSGSEFTLFNGNTEALEYQLPDISTEPTVVPAGESNNIVVAFGFNNDIDDLSLNLSEFLGHDEEDIPLKKIEIK